MKKILSLTLLGIILNLSLTSCKKDTPDEPVPPTTQGKKLIGYMDSDGNAISSVTYDERGRISFIAGTAIDDETKQRVTTNITYRYTNDSIKVSVNGDAGNLMASLKYKLDEKHRIIKAIITEFDEDDPEVYAFFYDKHNQLVRISSDDESSQTITWREGNISSVATREDGSTSIEKYTYTDYSAKHFISLGAIFGTPEMLGVESCLFMQGYYGTYPKNLIKGQFGGNGYSELTFTYELDADGYVTKASDSKGANCMFFWQ